MGALVKSVTHTDRLWGKTHDPESENLADCPGKQVAVIIHAHE